SLPDFLAFLEADLDDLAVDARLHRHGGIRFDIADRLDAERNELLEDGLDRHRNCWRTLRRLAFVRANLRAEIQEQHDSDSERTDAAENHPALGRVVPREARASGNFHGFANDGVTPRIPSGTPLQTRIWTCRRVFRSSTVPPRRTRTVTVRRGNPPPVPAP